MSLARAANRAFDRNDMSWFDLIALSGRELDEAVRRLSSDQIEAVLETREFNQALEQFL